ncbi:beach-domain-containing protein [Gigaspora margarita]|uniref:Beach-domain-containing protein n=1 Tax=Gigaspora margarita TaxID=4874 RepID=A0A8H4AV41_GIGMA|nr:beach-domain-containing protein [Gigaspora margarita]
MDGFIEILFPIVCACDELPIETEKKNKDQKNSFDNDIATDLKKNSIKKNTPGALPVLVNLPRSIQVFEDETGEEMIKKTTGKKNVTILTDTSTVKKSASKKKISPVDSDID